MTLSGVGPDPLRYALRMASSEGLRMRTPDAGAPLEAASKSAPDVDPRLREATVALEGVFARELVRALRGTVPEGGSPDAPGGDIYTSLFDDHLAEVLTGDDGLGLSSAMLKQLLGGVDPESGGSR